MLDHGIGCGERQMARVKRQGGIEPRAGPSSRMAALHVILHVRGMEHGAQDRPLSMERRRGRREVLRWWRWWRGLRGGYLLVRITGHGGARIAAPRPAPAWRTHILFLLCATKLVILRLHQRSLPLRSHHLPPSSMTIEHVLSRRGRAMTDPWCSSAASHPATSVRKTPTASSLLWPPTAALYQTSMLLPTYSCTCR